MAQTAQISSAYHWRITPQDARAGELAIATRTSPLFAQLLLGRNVCDLASFEKFIHPSLADLSHPFDLPGLSEAADCLCEAVRRGKRIAIYGDYDVDGVTSAAILWHVLSVSGVNPVVYLPDRNSEGYGLNVPAVTRLIEQGVETVVTVDTGITGIDAARVLFEAGVDLVVSDHHRWQVGPEPILPSATAIVHPRLGTSPDRPDYDICGAGVALQLAWGLALKLSGQDRVAPEYKQVLLEAVGLASLGTVSDVVPLTRQNRILVTHGLQALASSRIPGVQALLSEAGMSGRKLQASDLAFILGPRINASGRMSHARHAFELLTTTSTSRASELAAQLTGLNRDRQEAEKKILEQARELVISGQLQDKHAVIVLGSSEWSSGIVGIVANRLVDEFARPTILLSIRDGIGHGSGRSVPNLNLVEAMESCRKHVMACGGHDMAGGVTLRIENLAAFQADMDTYARAAMGDEIGVRSLQVDAEADLSSVNPGIARDIERLEPFGQGNPKPLVLFRGVRLMAAPVTCGQTNQHLVLYLGQGETRQRAIWFKHGNQAASFPSGQTIDVVASIATDPYRGVTLAVKDVAASQG